MIVTAVLRSGHWLDRATATVVARVVTLGIFTDPGRAQQVMLQAVPQGWLGVTQTWMEEHVIDALGPDHDAQCELQIQPFCNCWTRAHPLTPTIPNPTIHRMN